MKKTLLRVGCLLLAAGMLTSCSLLPSATPLPEPKPQQQPLYDSTALNDGKLRILYQNNGSTVLCGSTVLYQGNSTDSLSLVPDVLTGELNYYFRTWSDSAVSSGRRSALYDRDGNTVLSFDQNYNAFLYGDLLVLSNEGDFYDSSTAATPESCRVVELSTGAELPTPENAVGCIVSGDTLIFNCYSRPENLSDGEYDDSTFSHTSVLFYDRSGAFLGSAEHAQAMELESSISSEWVCLYVYPADESAPYSVDALLCNTLTGETLSGFENSFGNGVVSQKSDNGGIQLVDMVSGEQPTVLCAFDSSVVYYAPGVAVTSTHNSPSSSYSYEFHDLTTGEVKLLYNADASDKTLVIYAADGTLRVYDRTTGAVLTDLTIDPLEDQTSARVSADGEDYVTVTINHSNDYAHPTLRFYNSTGLLREMTLDSSGKDYQYINSLVFANGQPYFVASWNAPNDAYLYDVLDVNGNVLLSGLRSCYAYYTFSTNALPEGSFVAQKGFQYGWMDLDGQWLYCRSIFATSTDEDDMNDYF